MAGRFQTAFLRCAAALMVMMLGASPAMAQIACTGVGCFQVIVNEEGQCLQIGVEGWLPLNITLELTDTTIALTTAEKGTRETTSTTVNPDEIAQCALADRTLASAIQSVMEECSLKGSRWNPVPAPQEELELPPHGGRCISPGDVVGITAYIPGPGGPCIGDACFTLEVITPCGVRNHGEREAAVTAYGTDLRTGYGEDVPAGESADFTQNWDVCPLPAVLWVARFK